MPRLPLTRALAASLPLLAAGLLTGCFGTETTAFPDGLEPVEENLLAPPAGTAADPFPEEIVFEGREGGRFDVVLGRGYIQAPIADVWEAFQDPAVGADRRTSPEWTTTPLDDPEYVASYTVDHITYDIVTVEWEVTWRHGLVEGTLEAPEVVAIRWQKTDGSTLIAVINGSLILRPAGDGSVTELELAYQANATASGLENYIRAMQDTYDDALARVYDRPLPTYGDE